MDSYNADIISKSESQMKKRNGVNANIVDLEAEVKIEVKTEIDNVDTETYDLRQTMGEKRKNAEIREIQTKKIKEEFVVFEESYGDQPQTEPIDEDNPVFK